MRFSSALNMLYHFVRTYRASLSEFRSLGGSGAALCRSSFNKLLAMTVQRYFVNTFAGSGAVMFFGFSFADSLPYGR